MRASSMLCLATASLVLFGSRFARADAPPLRLEVPSGTTAVEIAVPDGVTVRLVPAAASLATPRLVAGVGVEQLRAARRLRVAGTVFTSMGITALTAATLTAIIGGTGCSRSGDCGTAAGFGVMVAGLTAIAPIVIGIPMWVTGAVRTRRLERLVLAGQVAQTGAGLSLAARF